MFKLERVEVQSYTFGGYKIIAKKYETRYRWTWLMICEDCGQQINIRKLGSEYWVAKCNTCKIEYTITPGDVYKATETNLERIMG